MIEAIKKSEQEGQWTGYNLIYIDNNEIPEVVKVGKDDQTGSNLLGYISGENH